MAESSNFTPIRIYRSETPDQLPAAPNLAVGELAVNIDTAALYTKNTNGDIVEIGLGSGVVTIAQTLQEYLENQIKNNIIINEYFQQQLNIVNRPPVKTITADYTITSADESYIIRVNSESDITVTLPSSNSETLPVGFIVHLYRYGSGELIVSPENGATLRTAIGNKARSQYSSVSPSMTSLDDWMLLGDAKA